MNEDSLLKTEDILLKTKHGLLKTEDNVINIKSVNICLQCTQLYFSDNHFVIPFCLNHELILC